MKIDSKMITTGALVYYDKGFRDCIEAHLSLLRNSSQTQSISVDEHKAAIYEGDLFGYLNELNISPQLHWVTMRMMNLFSPFDFGINTKNILLPNANEIDIIRQANNASGKVINI
jgi:hypothetical protein